MGIKADLTKEAKTFFFKNPTYRDMYVALNQFTSKLFLDVEEFNGECEALLQGFPQIHFADDKTEEMTFQLKVGEGHLVLTRFVQRK